MLEHFIKIFIKQNVKSVFVIRIIHVRGNAGMKKRKVLYGILTALFLTTFSVPAMAQENMGNASIISAEDHSSDPAIMEDGMHKEQNRISFYRHGSVVKNRWLNYKGSRY